MALLCEVLYEISMNAKESYLVEINDSLLIVSFIISELFTVLIDGVICQMHKQIAIIDWRSIILFSCEST